VLDSGDTADVLVFPNRRSSSSPFVLVLAERCSPLYYLENLVVLFHANQGGRHPGFPMASFRLVVLPFLRSDPPLSVDPTGPSGA